MNVNERLVKIVSSLFKTDPSAITLEADMDSIEAWDSLGHLNLIMAVEKEFKIKFQTDQFVLLDSVEKIQQALQQKSAL